MKRWNRKLLAGLLSFGMLLQVASPLSALAADSSSAAPGLTITLLRENEDTPYVGKIDQNTDSITLDGQSYQVDYQDGTYTLTGTMGTFYGSHIGDHLTISGPSDGVKPNLVVRKGENHEVANAYVKVENVNDFTSDSIAGITEFTCDGDINITADYYAVDFSFKVNSAHDVTVISEKATGQFVVGSAYINCTGKVTLRNEGQGALTHGSGITIRGAQDGVELYCKNATRMANGISIKNCKGDISIINENGPIGDPSVSNNLTVGGSGDTGVENVTIKANAPGPVTNGKISVTAKTLNMQNDGGSIGNLTFTRTDTTSAYRAAVGDSESSNTQAALTGMTYSATVNEKYLNIQPGTPENTTPDNAELKITAGGKDYRIDPKDISEYGKEYTIGYDTFWIYYHSEYDEFDIYGTVPDGTQIEGIGTHRPALQMTASTAGGIAHPLTYGSLTIKNMGDVHLSGVIDGSLTIENVKDVSSGVVGYAGSGNLIINGAENVKYLTHVFGTIDINCTGEVNIYGSRNGSVSDGANITAKSLMMKSVSINGSVGNVGRVKFTRTDTASNYRILTGENEDTITSQTAMTGATFDQTVEETYLCIEPGEPEDASKPDVPSYGFKVNGETANENTLPVGLVYANGKLTATSTNYTGDLTIEVTDPALKLDVSLQSVTGDVTLLGVNDVAITGTVNGMLTVGAEDAYASGNVTVNGRLLGGTEINCIGDVKATGSSDGGILKTKDFDQPDIIRCNGTVYLENTGNGYTTCSLTVIGATDVTVKANGGFHAAISGEGDITCSGTVTLTTTGVRAMGSNDPLTYNPMRGDSYTVQLDDQAPFTRTGIFKESEVNLLKNVKSIIITPTGSTPAPGPDDGDTTPDDTGTVDSGSDAGGAVAAVLVGSAAVWGGYEIATRVILHNILPEGTAIPANRGQLALLVWNNAGRPEPAAQPAFADVADADMAKAAQWCAEQGIMEAKNAETFKPEGWTPKLKVIEVWNKAFPKQ